MLDQVLEFLRENLYLSCGIVAVVFLLIVVILLPKKKNKVAEPVVEEPTAEEPKVEEPVVEETPAEEPAAEETPVEESNDTGVRYCGQCGTKLGPESKFCPTCGNQVR